MPVIYSNPRLHADDTDGLHRPDPAWERRAPEPTATCTYEHSTSVDADRDIAESMPGRRLLVG